MKVPGGDFTAAWMSAQVISLVVKADSAESEGKATGEPPAGDAFTVTLLSPTKDSTLITVA